MSGFTKNIESQLALCTADDRKQMAEWVQDIRGELVERLARASDSDEQQAFFAEQLVEVTELVRVLREQV
jgi:hypothetical protein